MSRTDARDLVATALEALGRYRLRTTLSVLGVVLGVASVIAMLSVSEGAAREAMAQVEALGLDNLVLRTQSLPGATSPRPLRAGDAARLATLLPLTEEVTPLVERRLTLLAGGHSTDAPVLGVQPSYFAIAGLTVRTGRALSAVDDLTAARVCVLGAAVARRLFGFRTPVGQAVRVGDDYVRVAGVLAPSGSGTRGSTTLAWRDPDEVVLLPFALLSGTTVGIGPDQPVEEVWVKLQPGERSGDVVEVLTHTLAQFDGGRDAAIIAPRELLAQRQRLQRTFSIVVGSVAVLALLVGGIGIMNIMLTSVVERTREIGIRRTSGATRQDVARQFLTEALLMTLLGGIAGIVLGIGASVSISAFAAWQTHVSVTAVVLGVVVSCLVGVVFGWYPAVQAARLEPVDAMRYE